MHTVGGFGNAAEAAHPSKPLDVEGLDRLVWIDEEDGDHTASMIVDVQLWVIVAPVPISNPGGVHVF